MPSVSRQMSNGDRERRRDENMAHKKKLSTPVPAGNRSQAGPAAEVNTIQQAKGEKKSGARFQVQDPKRRLGDYDGTGEHALQQPGGKNDANR
jgi:hypothetical protein